MDSLIFMSDPTITSTSKEQAAEQQKLSLLAQVKSANQDRQPTSNEVESPVEVENVERPVDLYKVCLSSLFRIFL